MREAQLIPVQPGSHLHDCVFLASQWAYVLLPWMIPLSTTAPWSLKKSPTLVALPSSAVLSHVPWPLHPSGHASLRHASPSYPSLHLHSPVLRSQIPALEHCVVVGIIVPVREIIPRDGERALAE